VTALAAERDVTPAQVALAWVLAQGEDIVPIPGTTKPHRVEENVAAAELELSAEELERLDLAAPVGAAVGDRYPTPMMHTLVRWQAVPAGKLSVQPLRLPIGGLDWSEQLVLEALRSGRVELLVGLTKICQRDADLVSGQRKSVKQLLPRLGVGVGHLLSLSHATGGRPRGLSELRPRPHVGLEHGPLRHRAHLLRLWA
jgi:hypothetical protein